MNAMNMAGAPPAPQPVLELRGVTKRFGAFTANDEVNLAVVPGEIHAILGENGAGKSTLMKMIYGVLTPDAGQIRWRGEDCRLRNPAHARELGIGMVFQHFSLFESLTVAENISLAIPESVAVLRGRIGEVSQRYGLPVDPDAVVHGLSMGLRQRVEIIRCLLQEPRLIILDEPTSVLPPSAVPAFFETIRALADSGCAVLFISHKMEEIRSLSHRATVMRAGRIVATVDPRIESCGTLAKLMIGREIPNPTRAPARTGAQLALDIRDLTVAADNPFGTTLRDVSLDLRPGEILGIAGVSGNGQRQLANILSGERVLPKGMQGCVTILERDCCGLDSGARRRLGMAYVSEDRNRTSSVPDMTLEQNALLTAHGQGLVARGLIQRGAVGALARRCIAAMDVRCSGPGAEARSLSGGNLQKFIIGRELALKPRLLIVAQPTWGVDIGAAQSIRQKLVDLRDEGVAVMLISDELDELLETADRIQVMFRGRLSPSLQRDAVTDAQLGAYMAGDFDFEATPGKIEEAPNAALHH